MSLCRDALRYSVAHRRFVDAACAPGGVSLMGAPSDEYTRLERCYEALTQHRPWLRWFIGTRFGMRTLLAWTS